MSEQSQVQITSETATKGGKREIFTENYGLEVVRLRRKFIDPKKFVKRGALESDFDRHKIAIAEVDVLREIYPALEVKSAEGKTWGIEPVLKGDFFGVKKI